MTDEQRRALLAAMERILPSEHSPGAATANAIGYVDWRIHQPSFKHWMPCFTSGLLLLDSLAEGMWNKEFAGCSAPEQDAVLRHMQLVPHPVAQQFFAMLMRMTLAGFLCSPTHGGNCGGVGWAHIGFVPHPLTLGATHVLN